MGCRRLGRRLGSRRLSRRLGSRRLSSWKLSCRKLSRKLSRRLGYRKLSRRLSGRRLSSRRLGSRRLSCRKLSSRNHSSRNHSSRNHSSRNHSSRRNRNRRKSRSRMIAITTVSPIIRVRTRRSVDICSIAHFPIPSITTLAHILLIIHIVILVVICVSCRAHRPIRDTYFNGMNQDIRFSQITGRTKSSIKSIVEFVVTISIEVQSAQFGEVLLIHTHCMKIRNDLVLENSCLFFTSSVGCNIVTRDLEVFQIHKVALLTIINHPL